MKIELKEVAGRISCAAYRVAVFMAALSLVAQAGVPSAKLRLDQVPSGGALWQSFDSLPELNHLPISVRSQSGACEWLESIKTDLNQMLKESRGCNEAGKTADDMIMIIESFTYLPDTCDGARFKYGLSTKNKANAFTEQFIKTVDELKSKINNAPIECASDLAPLLE